MFSYSELWFSAELQGERGELPGFLGATLRGVFGFLLKETVCQVAHGQCPRCLLQPACPYPSLFEGLPPADRTVLRKYSALPQPFLLLVPAPAEARQQSPELAWGVRLFGRAIQDWLARWSCSVIR